MREGYSYSNTEKETLVPSVQSRELVMGSWTDSREDMILTDESSIRQSQDARGIEMFQVRETANRGRQEAKEQTFVRRSEKTKNAAMNYFRDVKLSK